MLSFCRKVLSICAVALPVVLAGWVLQPGIQAGQADEISRAAGQPRQLFPQPPRGSEGAGAASLFQQGGPSPMPAQPQPSQPLPPSLNRPPPAPPAVRGEARPLPSLPPRKPQSSSNLLAGAKEKGEAPQERQGKERLEEARIMPLPPLTAKEGGTSLSWPGNATFDPEPDILPPPPAVAVAGTPKATPRKADAAEKSDLTAIRHLVQQALEDPEEEQEIIQAMQGHPEGHLPAAIIARQGAEAPPLASVVRMPLAFDLQVWEGRDFIAERQRLQQAIVQREREGLSAATQALDLAWLYASRALAHEALSLLDDLDERELLPRQRAAAQALGDMLRVWRAPEALHELAIVGDADFAEWEEWALWTAYGQAARHEWKAAAKLAQEGLQRLDAYPRVLRVPLLIALTEVMMMTGGDLAVVGAALASLEGERLEPADRAALGYLTALAQEARGEPREAFQSYLTAAGGEGPYAQKARIAVVDVGVSSGQMSLEEAEALLSSAHHLWRGDRLEVEVLKRLAALRLELQDKVGVVEALARLALNFSGEPIAEQALANAGPLLDEMYRLPQRREHSIGQRITSHERLRRAFGNHAFFRSYREAFAGDLSEAGLKAAAAQEYALLAEDAPGRQGQAYSLKRAASLVEAGAHASAREVLKAMTLPDDPELARQWRRLGARLVASGEVPPREDIEAQLRADEDLSALLLRAETAWSERRWPLVVALYDSARRNYPEAFGETELLRLLIASYREGEKELFSAVVQEHEALARGTDWHALASMLMENPPSLHPLSSREARGVIDQADDVRRLVLRALDPAGV